MEELLKEVLIKECGDLIHDKVFIVENLPKKFLYEKTIRMVQHVGEGGFRNGSLVPDPNGEMIDTLYPGIERSQTGDGGFVFWTTERESKERLGDIDRFIDRVLPRDARIVARIPYAQKVGDASSPPIRYHQIPHMTLPIILQPQATAPTLQESPSQVPAQSDPSLISEGPEGRSKKDIIHEKRVAAMAKARAARKTKKVVAAA